jgi:hypothetical protein
VTWLLTCTARCSLAPAVHAAGSLMNSGLFKISPEGLTTLLCFLV